MPEQQLGLIFISYRRDDSADIAGRIYDRLVQRFGEDSVFKDVDSIPSASTFASISPIASRSARFCWP
jgi:hypothetical protein